MRRRGSSWLALACLLAATFAAGPAQAAPTLPVTHSGRWITDVRGRVVLVHGINMVSKLPPYYPAKIGFGDDDAAFLARIGFNAVRVGVIWKAVEPTPGRYDDAYLRQIARTVKTLARHHVLALLDYHQDMYNERFQGEGAPDWAVQDGGLPNLRLGFPTNYLLSPAVQHAFDQFWADASGPGGVGLEDRFAASWKHVAARFKGTASLLGYELLNEPWPGTVWQPCALPAGCPDFDAKLAAFYRRVFPRLRTADRRSLVWYEPNVLFNDGSATHLPRVGDRRTGFSFHDYCLTESATGPSATCTASDDKVFANAVARGVGIRQAVMETEFGATNDIPYLDEMVARGDRFMVPWLEWAYCGCQDPTTSGPGNKQAIVIDPAKAPSGANLESATLRALVEPYPQVVAGTPRSWRFTRSTRTLTLHYSTARAGGSRRFKAGSLTEIAAPALVYRGHYAARVIGGVPVSKPGAATLQIASCPGARSVSVRLAPKGPSRGACRRPR
jgi:endoglycosylceramidase